MKLIPLNRIYKRRKFEVPHFAQVDDEDYDFLMQWNWFMVKCDHSQTHYARRNEYLGVINGRKKQITIHMHRVILDLKDKKFEIDHRDRDGLNNQKSNLRICQTKDNVKNINSRKNSTSKYLGVSWKSKNKKWVSQIKCGKVMHLGLYDKEEDAALAYNNAAIKHHGEFASLNIIPSN